MLESENVNIGFWACSFNYTNKVTESHVNNLKLVRSKNNYKDNKADCKALSLA